MKNHTYRRGEYTSVTLLAAVLLASWLHPARLFAASTITYIQGNYATPQTAQTSVTAPYTAAQTAGNLNVVVVGWNDSTSTVSSVTDKSGNAYALAVGPMTVSGYLSQSIYYARNIAAAGAAANSVTVTFSKAAISPDVRILEYSGADLNAPVDVTASATGNSSTSTSATATTTNATDLIFGANIVYTLTSGPGSGFTKRLLTSPDGDIAEDKMVTSTGSYSTTAPLSSSGLWIMQMVAFRTAGAGGSFAASASPASLSVTQGGQGTSTITTTGSGGFNNAISLAASGAPTGTTVSFNPSTIAAPGSGTATMTVSLGSNTATGTYTLTVTGNGGGVQQTTTVGLTITAVPTTITYVQGNYATPQSAQTTVTVPYTAAQSGDDLNVVVVGWNDSTATVSSVTDKSGNTYTLAVGPTTYSGYLSQSIYYAKNIVGAAAGANSVTVTWATAAANPDIRILEYSGASLSSPVDATAAATGNSATSSSGAATTTNATDLIFGANMVETVTSGPGSGFTKRLLTSPDGDIAEDEMVTTAGSYSAAAALGSGQWVMQMVAFRTSGGATGSFTVSASPSSLSVAQGQQGMSTITTSVGGGFNSSIALSATGAPTGTTVGFSPSTIAAPSAGTSLMTITVGSNTAVGTYSISVVGNGGGVQQSATVTLTVGTVSSTIGYVQGNYSTPQTAQATVTVPFTSPQNASDLNVVVVGWNDTTATVSSVTDTSGNTYTRAVGPTVYAGYLSQSIYYAKNIVAAAGGANTVSVTFSTAAASADIRILEYSGVNSSNPVDVTAGASGSSAASSSGPATTTNAADFIFGANMVYTSTTGPGSGFTQRLLTSPDGDNAEDELTTTAGSYSATAPLGSAGPWVMQMVAFRTATAAPPQFAVAPAVVVLTPNLTQQFTTQNGSGSVTWSVDGVAGGTSSTGTITANGLYTPPSTTGTHTITGTPNQGQAANATVYISNYAGTFTYHNDNLRTGQNLTETVLTTGNVNPTQFGKLFSYPLDGIAFASPLYVENVNIPGSGSHNVVYAATENDSVYAFDADGRSTAPLWKVSFLKSGVTPVPCADTGECGDIPTQIGITGTPVMDSSSGTLYVVAATKEGSTWVQRLHALDITTGAEKFGGPVVIQGSVPGSGEGGTSVPFNPLTENQRPGLLLSNGVVYFAFASHGDNSPWHGWVFGYNAKTLQQVMLDNATPNGGGGGIWQGGGGLSTDANGNIYFVTGNGTFDANTGGVDFGDTVEKLSTNGTVLDYFTPYDQANMDNNDLDLGAGGPVLLVDQTTGPYPHLLITAGKTGTIYVVNRDNMGGYNPNNDSQIVQSLGGALANGGEENGNFSTPVYFNGWVYFAAVNDYIKAFQLSNGLLSTSPTSESPETYPCRGGSFAISASGTSNGILWALQNFGDPSNDATTPGVLYAYDATNLTHELYNTNQNVTRDVMDFPAKFAIPLVANGKVFVAGQTQLIAYGLLP